MKRPLRGRRVVVVFVTLDKGGRGGGGGYQSLFGHRAWSRGRRGRRGRRERKRNKYKTVTVTET